ncbi:lipolytic enzyme, partial [Megasphaera massiliensis]|nr:lipolytic enzyme [Megasphaera massiliensis]
AERFEKDVLPFKPSFVIVLVGSNSLRAGGPSWEVIGDLQSIKNQALENGIKPVFLTIPPLTPRNIKAAFDQATTDD